MKKLLPVIFLFLSLAGFAQDIPPKPNPARLVNDVAHVLTADQASSLESKLVAYDDSTSIQIVVVTVPSVGDYPMSDYALKILRDWGVGNKKTNNGLVILASIKEHKVFIATGYGMEGAVPDITAKEIIDNEIVPSFKQGDYYSGFNHGADAVIKASAGEYKAPEGYGGRKNSGGGSIIGFLIIIVIVIVLMISRGGRGGSSGGGGGMLPWILASMLSSGGRGGGGGWSGGGGFGGGGGGGFGGFGGGSGGGGGAGGSW